MISTAFDPETFRERGRALVDRLADYLHRALRGEIPVLPWRPPAEMAAAWATSFPEGPAGDPRALDELFARVIAEANHLPHPRYIGHQVTAPLPVAALADLVAALLNNGMAVYEMGPSATAIERTLECTKRMLGLELYAALAIHGTQLFGDYVADTFDRARRFAERLAREPDFELLIPPQCDIVCFRHRPAGATDLDALQTTLRRRLIEDGSFYLVQTRLPAGVFLRIAVINPATSDADLDALVCRLREAAQSR